MTVTFDLNGHGDYPNNEAFCTEYVSGDFNSIAGWAVWCDIANPTEGFTFTNPTDSNGYTFLGWYYNRAMHGSYSIKYVLPALFPGDPELDYHNLDGVHNGTEASETYLAMWHMPDDEIVRKCEELDRYCSLDTYAMVKVWEKLNESLTLE